MLIPTIVTRTITLFGGIAVERAINKIVPVSKDLFKADPIATIGNAIIQAASADFIMSYVEDRLVKTLDSIALPTPELEKIEPAVNAAPAPKTAIKPARKAAK